MDSPFDVLRIDSDADEREVDRAYRRRVMEAHPDQGGSAREFRSVRAAYEAIKSGTDVEEWADDGDEEWDLERESVDDPNRGESRVEYLDYEVMADHGWTLDDEDLFEKASAAGLDASDYGRILVQPNESILQAAENRGFAWPYACRGGACANCAIAVVEGEMTTPVNHVLPPEMTDRGIRLSCNGVPTTETMKVVFNLKHLPSLDELRLPPRPFERAHLND
ncbi:ferredoxin Fer [Halalkalicoccus salilacus]|uniref:ferredoxin Fer n=1 Tax=Halalkalicoccus salilacus TaxID=3117459 RepID=UPI00300E757E